MYDGIWYGAVVITQVDSTLFNSLLTECWSRNHKSMDAPEELQLDLITELYAFLTTKKAKSRAIAPLVNLELKIPNEELAFSENIQTRKLSALEATRLFELHRGGWSRTHEFAIISEATITCGFGEPGDQQGLEDARSAMLPVELSLRLAKGGSVGIDCIHFM